MVQSLIVVFLIATLTFSLSLQTMMDDKSEPLNYYAAYSEVGQPQSYI